MTSDDKKLLYYLNGQPVYKTDVEINKFPFEQVYPELIKELIRDLHDKFGFPLEFTSTTILMAFATAIGSTIQLQFKEKFVVMANLYCVMVGDPGTCKTHPIRLLFRVIDEAQSSCYAKYAEEIEEYNAYEKKSKKEKEEIPFVKKPKLKIHTLDNYTLEILLKRLYENPRGLSIVVDELNGLFENMNRYNSGSDAETYNSLWSGVPTSVNRITSEPFYIHPTAVSIFGTIQTAMLDKVCSKDKDKNGFENKLQKTELNLDEDTILLEWSEK